MANDPYDFWASLQGPSQEEEDAGRVDFWSGVNNQTPQEFETSQVDYQQRQAADSKQQALINRANAGDMSAVNELERQRRVADNQAWSNFQGNQVQQGTQQQTALDPYTNAFNTQYNQNQGARQQNIANQTSAFNSATQANSGLFQGLQGAQQSANSRDAQTLARQDQRFGQSDSMDAQNVGQLSALNGSMQQLQAGGYTGVSSDPGDIARQQQAYGDFQNWSSGANDISSDPGLVAQQQGVYEGFGGFASGQNAISSDAGLVGMQQGVYDDYGQFASGAMDLESQAANAVADPEALAAQKEALGEFRERMDPKLTDAERFLYMQSRLQQEQGQRAVRDANYRELERRGMGGSTMALSNLNASSAEASNTRALQDLGANAKAVDRAEKALVNYGNMSSTIADQSFERDFSTKSAADRMAVNNNQQRLQGIAGQGQMATNMRNADDDIKKFNNEQMMQGLQGQGTMANAMRTADDSMRSGNADRRLAGTQGMAQQSNAIRSANDAMLTFNKDQEMTQSRFQDDYRAEQQRQAWDRGVDVSDAGFKQTEGMDRRTDSSTRNNLAQSDAEFGRANTTTNTGMTANRDYVEGYDRLTGRGEEAMRGDAADLSSAGEFELGRGKLQNESQRDVNDTQRERLRSNSEDRRATEAVTQAYRDSQAQQKYDKEHEDYWAL